MLGFTPVVRCPKSFSSAAPSTKTWANSPRMANIPVWYRPSNSISPTCESTRGKLKPVLPRQKLVPRVSPGSAPYSSRAVWAMSRTFERNPFWLVSASPSSAVMAVASSGAIRYAS